MGIMMIRKLLLFLSIAVLACKTPTPPTPKPISTPVTLSPDPSVSLGIPVSTARTWGSGIAPNKAADSNRDEVGRHRRRSWRPDTTTRRIGVGMFGSTLTCIDPATLERTSVAAIAGAPANMTWSGGDLYFSVGPELRVVHGL